MQDKSVWKIGHSGHNHRFRRTRPEGNNANDMMKKSPETHASAESPPGQDGSSAAAVAEGLRALIIDGELPAGARITERAVAERFDCTASTTREAFHLLEKQGAIMVSARRGARVIDADYAPPRELFVVWDRLRWLLGEELRRHDASAEPASQPEKAARTRSQRLKLVERQLALLSRVSGNPRLADVMGQVALHVCIVAPERLAELEESLSQ